MELLYKPDWPEARQRMEAFWRGEELDRIPLWVTAPRRTPLPGPQPPPEPPDPKTRKTDPNYLLARAQAAFSRTFYGGESVPAFEANLGPGSLAIHLGSRPVFMPTTVWYEPILDDLEHGPDLAFDENEPWWRWTVELTARAREEGRGKFLLAFPDLIENLDTLCSLRGTLELLTDLIDHPQAVHRYLEQIFHAYFACYDALAELMNVAENGSLFTIFRVWGPGRVCKLQSDMSCMISPEMFAEFAVPYLRRQCQRVDQSFFHLDGPGAIKHLDALLAIPELGGIQWTPGAGAPPVHSERWWPMYRKIQAAGKRLFLLGVPPEKVPELARRFERNLTYIATHCPSQDEAEALLREASRW